jgi:hypothetical protein
MRAVAAAVALAGCGPWGGRFDASWTGSEKGRMSGQATAAWCRETHTAVLTAVRGDTGVSLLIHPAESLAAGRYPILEPGSARQTVPAAAAALRLVSTTAVVGYQSQSGTLTLESAAGGGLSGRFEVTAKITSERAGTVKLTGRFRDVRLAPGGTLCPG